MYVQHWNLREKPFQNVTDIRFTYLSEQHEEGLARLIYLVKNRRIGGVLTGPYGAGKSMIIELLAEHVRADTNSRFLAVSIMPGEIIALARRLLEFTGYSGVPGDMTSILEAMQDMAGNSTKTSSHIVLAIDEAQMITDNSTWQFLHLLTNITSPSKNGTAPHNTVTLILCGHTDLIDHLQAYQALSQRMQLVWTLAPLSENQTVEYIQQRIRAAGGDIWLFNEGAMRAIYNYSGGLPRSINNLCDTALMLGFAGKQSIITQEIAELAAKDTHSELLTGHKVPTGGGNHA